MKDTLSDQEIWLSEGPIMHTAPVLVNGGSTLKFTRFPKV